MKVQEQKIISPVDVKKRQNLNIKTGDTVRVSLKIEEKGKTRIQVFEGIVLARKHGNEAGATFTVRRVSSGVGVEKIFTLYSPYIEDIEVTRRAKVRQANLYHIRRKAAKEVRRQMKNTRVVSESASEQEGDEVIDESPEEIPQSEDATATEAEATETNNNEEVTEEETTPEQKETPVEDKEEKKEEEVKGEEKTEDKK